MATEKRILDTQKFWASHMIFDIEGTTTSISFVKDTLFPYIRTNLEKYLNDNWRDEGFQCVITALREQAKADENDGLEGFVAIPEGDNDEVKNAVIKNVLWQMDNDRKTKSLKDLQSLVMTNGYETGNIIGHIYDDVDTNLKAWKEQGKLLYIYSSGSVNAQKLLFGNTNKGNLLNLFSGHFDTLVGPKTESSSYKRILDEMKSEPGDVLFFTDVPAEAKAAVSAGLQAVLVSRDGNAPLSDQDKADFTVIHSFSDVEFEQNTKKRKMLNDTNCDIVIDNKEVERSSTYISEAVSREGDDQIKPNISLDTDVEMVEVEEKAICTKVSKKETEILEEEGSCKESDVDMKVQSNPELIKDNMKSSESIGEDLPILSKNENDKTIVKNPGGEVKNNDIEGKKDNVEGRNEHDIEGKEEHDGSVVAQKYKCSADGEVSKESSITDSNEDTEKPVEESNENTDKSIQKMSDNQHVSLANNENVEVENKGTDNEMKNSVDSSDKNEIELSRKSKIQEEAAVKTQDEDRNEIRPVNKDEVEPAQTSKTDTGSAEMINLSENSKSDINDIGTDGVENKRRESITVKEAYHEKNTHAVTISEDRNDKEGDVTGHEESPKMLEAVSSVLSTSVTSAEDIVSNKFSATVKTAENISNATSVKISENTMSNTTSVEISENDVLNTTAVENAVSYTTAVENAVSNTTAVEMAENVVSNVTSIEISESAVSNTTAVEMAEKVVSNTTAVKITENAVSNTTAVKMEEENTISNATSIEISESAISNTTAVEMAEKVVSNTTAVEIAENAVSNTTAIKMAEENAISNATSIEISESAVSNTTAVEMTENVVSNTTALKIVEENVVSNTTALKIEENAVSNATAVKMAEENATSVEISESAVSNTTAVEVAENVVLNTMAVEIAENAISNTTAIKMAEENAISNTTSIEMSESAVSTAVEIAENAVANTTALKIVEENAVANATSVEIAENAVSNTKLVETAENAISNNTIVKIAENVSNSTLAEMIENTDTVEPMDVSESNEDAECKADVLNPEENKPSSNEEMSRQNGKECDQEMITDEITETNETTVCNIDPVPEKKIVEKENDINTKIELQEKIIENSVCSKMETENCDVISDTCEKDNILNESVAKKTVNDSDIELQKEESKPLKSDGFRLGVDNINEKENNEESMKTQNNKSEDVCINNLNEKKVECSDVSEEKIINTSHEKGNCSSVVAEKEDVTAASVVVNGKNVENYSCGIEKNKSNGDDSKAQVEVTPNGDTHKSHENIKTDDEKTDTINEKTESNTVVNGGTENIDSVPEMKKVINDAANNSALEAISQPI